MSSQGKKNKDYYKHNATTITNDDGVVVVEKRHGMNGKDRLSPTQMMILDGDYVDPDGEVHGIDKNEQQEEQNNNNKNNNGGGRDHVETYPADCYSFMAIHSPLKDPGFFAFGFLVFTFQIMFLLYMVLSKVHKEYSSSGEVDNPSNGYFAAFIPSNVETIVRATQVTAVLSYCIFADSSIKDVVQAVESFPRFDQATNDDHVRLACFSCFLRFTQGLLAIFATLLLIMTSSDVIDIILNFAAVNYISTLDETAFELAKWGKYGPRLEAEAKSIEVRPVPHCMSRKYQHVRYQCTVIPIAFALLLILTFIIYRQENNNFWVTRTMRVQFQDSTGLQSYSGCYEFDPVVNHHKRKNYNGFEDNPENGMIGYCKKSRSWILFKDGNNTSPCDVTRQYELAHSAKTDAFDVSSSFDGSWYSASGTPLDLYFFDTDENGDDLKDTCGSFLNNGRCDEFFNTLGYQYDGGDCCAATCQKSNCGVLGVTTAFGSNHSGNGFPNCIDPKMVAITIRLNDISNSRDPNVLEVTDLQVEEYFLEKGVNFWTEDPVTALFIVDCDEVNVLSTYVDNLMENQTETIMVEDGARCQISVSNTTNFNPKWDNDPIWLVNYTVFHGENLTNVISQSYSGEEESSYFHRIPNCYFDELENLINISTAYIADDSSTQALNWLTNDESGSSKCDGEFLIERFALSAVNFAAPINAANDDNDYDSSLWISTEQQCRWENIACNEGSVEVLAVRSQDLSGTIATSVGLLTGLRRMDYGELRAVDEMHVSIVFHGC